MLAMTPARRNRILLWLGIGLVVVVLTWAARRVLLPYALGLVLAYILLPFVNWLDRHMPARLRAWRISRPLSIILTYLLLLAFVAGIVAFLVPIVGEQVQNLIDHWPSLVSQFQEWGDRGLGWYATTVPESWKQTIESNLAALAGDLAATTREGLFTAVRTLFSTVGFFIGLVVVPFWLFYILHDENQVKAGVIRALPEQLRADTQCVAHLIDDVLSAYIRGQLLLCFFVGGMATIAMLAIGVPFAIVLGLIAAVFEILPYVGPILGAIPAILVALLSKPASAIWVAVSFFAIQQVENLVLVPRVAGKSVKLHPALVMVVLVIGNEVGGVWGMLVAVPVTAAIRDVFKYLHLRLMDEPLTPEEAMTRIRTGQEVQLGV
jgi:predicted PurR-regulated permease PerM